MTSCISLFDVGREGETLIISPTANLRELNFREIEEGMEKLFELLRSTPVRNVVLNFGKTDYFGSTALTLFIRLWKTVRARDGRMALCNVSDYEREILAVAKFDSLWPIYPSVEEALAAVGR